MTHDDELIERAAKVLHAEWMPEEGKFEQNSEDYREAFRDAARKLVTVVRAYDAERRASVPDIAAMVERFDPDDYRDLPLAMTEAVRFRGGLTEGKRE